MLKGKTCPLYFLQTDKSGQCMFLEDKGTMNSTKIVSSIAFRDYVNKLRNVQDYVIIDSPPITGTADATIISNIADISVLVVGYNSTCVQDINDAIDTLNEGKARLIGCVLNGIQSFSLSLSSYGYGYYGYYNNYGRYKKYRNYQKNRDRMYKEEAR